MASKSKIVFKDYDIELDEKDFENLSNEELEECKEIIDDIKKFLEE